MSGSSSTSALTTQPRLRRAYAIARNLLIGTILLLTMLESLPAIPRRIRQAAHPLALLVGCEQDQWQMFAPNPDQQNHRIWGVVEYEDGSERTWRPPDWREQSRWERFITHRLSKFCENIYNPGFLSALPTTAQWIATEVERQGQPPTAKPVRVTFWAEEAPIPDPHYFPWPSVDERPEFENKWQFGEHIFATKELP